MARRAGRLIYTLAMAATAAILPVACGAEADEPARATDVDADRGAVAREPGPDAEPDPGDAATDHYEASNDYMAAALRAPNPTDPGLADFFSGPALQENVDILLVAQQSAEYYESTLDSDPTVVDSDDTEVVLSDCVTETATTFDAASGQPKGSGSNVRNWQIRLVHSDAGWRVEQITTLEEPCSP